jgi:8-oxo-dGTP pyrophosphatase MutT (NUDIX family)
MSPNRLDTAEIERRLTSAHTSRGASCELPGESADSPCPASVLLPLINQDDRWHLLFIRRAEHEHDRHSGEVAFPGGRAEEGDPDPVATALREAREEIGLDPTQVRVLGRMRPLRTVSNYLVTPVVGHLRWPQTLTPDPKEVAEVFSLPLDWLGDASRRSVRIWPAPDHPQAREVIFYEERDGRLLWGISARITLNFLDCLGF